MKIFSKINVALIILLAISFSLISLPVKASIAEDADAYDKFPLYEKYKKKQKYDEYKKLQRTKKKLGFDDAKVKAAAKIDYMNYKLYKKNPAKYRSFAKFLPQYNAYKKYKKYSEYGKYKKYSRYNNDKYDKYGKYGSAAYEAGYNRYKAFISDLSSVTTATGPEISVGIWSKSHIDAESDPFRITASKTFNITDCIGTTLVQIPVGETARVKYIGSAGMLQVYNSNTPLVFTDIMNRVCMLAADGNNADMVFDVNTPDNISKGAYDQYRGKIKIQHSFTDDNYNLYQNTGFPDHDLANSKRRVWVVNTLPLEQYMWGYGEMGGGIDEHSKVMAVTGRTYARWYIAYATKWDDSVNPATPENGEGFDILSYSFSQIYNGYDYEIAHPLVPEAAKKTNGIVMKYGTDYILAAYSSYTDGNTRAFPGEPYMVSVPDPYGKNSSMTTQQMLDAGNHMWGLSASGSVVLARDHGWSWARILSYYYTGISIVKEY